MMASRQALEDYQHARALLENPFFVKLFDQLKADLITKFMNTELTDRDVREECYRLLNTLGAMKDVIDTAVSQGKYEENSVETMLNANIF